jgi:hypothetical protein
LFLNNPEWSQLAAVGRKVLPQSPQDSRRFIAALEAADQGNDLPQFALERLDAIREALAQQRARALQ